MEDRGIPIGLLPWMRWVGGWHGHGWPAVALACLADQACCRYFSSQADSSTISQSEFGWSALIAPSTLIWQSFSSARITQILGLFCCFRGGLSGG